MIKRTIRTKEEFDRLGRELNYDQPLVVEVKKLSLNRTQSQNSTQHMWYAEIAERFNMVAAEGKKPEELAKLAMKDLFLGYIDVKVSDKLTIKGQLISTKDLDKGEAQHYMDRIYGWCIEHGCFLTVPGHSEYAKLRDMQNG